MSNTRQNTDLKGMTRCNTLLPTVLLAVFCGFTDVRADKLLDDKCWAMTFEDSFDELSLWDDAKQTGQWKTSYIWDRDIRINNELQYYVDPRLHGINPFSVNNGILSITAKRSDDTVTIPAPLEYTSGVLTTEKGFSQKYGRFEGYLKVPVGQGLWPALWLLPSFDRWPDGVAVLPEIDIMEFLGHEPETFHTTVHTNQTGPLTSHPYDHQTGTDLTRSFHLYSVVWTAKSIRWYFDKRLVAEHPTPADMTRPMHFLLNLAVGGNWPGAPDDSTPFPATYQIDYVRAWQPKENC